MLGWLLGRVRFRAEGGDAENLLTACAGQGIPVSGVRATALGFTAWTPARCYHRLRPLARRSHTRVRLAKKQGLCFVLLLCTVMNLTPAGSRKKYMKLRRPLVKSRKL